MWLSVTISSRLETITFAFNHISEQSSLSMRFPKAIGQAQPYPYQQVSVVINGLKLTGLFNRVKQGRRQ